MANKPVLIVGGICVLLALASFGLAWSAGSQGIQDIENVEIEDYIQGPSTSFTYTYTDDDDQGSKLYSLTGNHLFCDRHAFHCNHSI